MAGEAEEGGRRKCEASALKERFLSLSYFYVSRPRSSAEFFAILLTCWHSYWLAGNLLISYHSHHKPMFNVLSQKSTATLNCHLESTRDCTLVPLYPLTVMILEDFSSLFLRKILSPKVLCCK